MHIVGAIDRDSRTLVLTGAADALAELAALLVAGRSGPIELDDCPVRAGMVAVSRLVLEFTNGDATIVAVDSAARLSGSSSELARLGNDISAFLEYNDVNKPGMHMHLIDAEPSDRAASPHGFSVILTGPVPDE